MDQPTAQRERQVTTRDRVAHHPLAQYFIFYLATTIPFVRRPSRIRGWEMYLDRGMRPRRAREAEMVEAKLRWVTRRDHPDMTWDMVGVHNTLCAHRLCIPGTGHVHDSKLH